eukprot:TRINITY_DN10148_c0_g1_i1.p1 TRINITY_DN10148_c0_g1~~TRINITY_DN10148_c0_g1_i1.p1  ORF type:complete len:1176 (+),score=167.86 TRINITY_DN10148_c0_g1_i1:43-3528(+)
MSSPIALTDVLVEVVRQHPVAVLVLLASVFLSVPCCCCLGYLILRSRPAGPKQNTPKPPPQTASAAAAAYAPPPRPPRERRKLKPDEATAPKRDANPFGMGLGGMGMGMGMGGMGGMGMGMGFPGMDTSELSRLGINTELLSQQFGPKDAGPKEKAVAVIIGVENAFPPPEFPVPNYRPPAAQAQYPVLDTAARDAFTMAAALQQLEFETYALHDDREAEEYKPTAENIRDFFEQLIENDQERYTDLVVYVACHARVSPVDSQPELLLQQLPGEAGPPSWLRLTVLQAWAFQLRTPTTFILDLALDAGCEPQGFLRRAKAGTKDRYRTAFIVAGTRPAPSPTPHVGLFVHSFRETITAQPFKHADVSVQLLHRGLYWKCKAALADNWNGARILYYSNELGQSPLNSVTFRPARPRGAPYLRSAPPYAVKPSVVSELISKLTNKGQRPRGGTYSHANPFVAPAANLHGPPGSGKTTAALSLAWDKDVLAYFSDGVFFLSLDTVQPPLEFLQHLATVSVGYEGYFQSETEAREFLCQHLSSALVILDGVTSAAEVDVFRFSFHAETAYRVLAISQRPLADCATIEELASPMALPDARLLLGIAAAPTDGFFNNAGEEPIAFANAAITEETASAVTAVTEGSPAALSLFVRSFVGCRKNLEELPDWNRLLLTYKGEGPNLSPIEKTVRMAVAALRKPQQRACAAELAVLPAGVPVSFEAVFVLWAKVYNEMQAASLLNRLARLGLIEFVVTFYGTSIWISPAVGRALREILTAAQWKPTNERIALTYLQLGMRTLDEQEAEIPVSALEAKPVPESVTERAWHAVPNDEYFYRWVPLHWRAAGMAEAWQLWNSLDWIRAKINGSDAYSLLADLAIDGEQSGSLTTLHEVLELSLPVLRTYKWEFASQVYARGWGSVDACVSELRQTLEKRSSPLTFEEGSVSRPDAWLRPLQFPGGTRSLHAQDEFNHHNGAVIQILFMPNGRVVTAAEDGIVKVWDVDSGRCVANLEHEAVTTLVISSGGKLATGSRERRTIKIWDDIESGESRTVEILPKPERTPEQTKPDDQTLLVTLGKTGRLIGADREVHRDALLVYTKKQEQDEISFHSDQLLFHGHDDTRPIIASWCHDAELRCAQLGETEAGATLVVAGDCNGSVLFFRLDVISASQ